MPNVDLYLMGAGIQFPSQLTVETIEIFGRCKRVVTNLPSDDLLALPVDIRRRFRSLWHLYRPGRVRRDNYADVIQAVLSIAEAERPIGWLTFGHPMVFDTVTEALLQESRIRAWKTLVIPAISSIDTVLASVEFEPANGLFIYEATSLIRRQVELNPRVGTMLLQPSVFQSDRATLTREEVVVNLLPLRSYLIRFYPASHSCAFVRSAMNGFDQHQIQWTTVGELPTIDAMAIAGSSLFIPPISVGSHANP